MISRRNFLYTASVTGAAMLSRMPLEAQSATSTEPESGAAMPTLGRVTDRALPTNPPRTGARYRPPFRVGMGGTEIGNCFASTSDEQAEAALEAAWNAGVRYFDTSPFYGYGLSERRLGHFLHRHRPEEYILSTKVGRVFKASKNPPPSAFWKQPSPFSYVYDYSADGARRSVEDSLQRLGVSQIDIVYIHDVSPDNTELSQPWDVVFDSAVKGAMAELTRMRDEGMIKGWGFGINTPNAAIRVAETGVADPDIVLLACQYSILDHEDTLDRTFPALEKAGISVTVGTPLNAGFLTGRNRFNFGSTIPPEMLEKRNKLTQIATQLGVDG